MLPPPTTSATWNISLIISNQILKTSKKHWNISCQMVQHVKIIKRPQQYCWLQNYTIGTFRTPIKFILQTTSTIVIPQTTWKCSRQTTKNKPKDGSRKMIHYSIVTSMPRRVTAATSLAMAIVICIQPHKNKRSETKSRAARYSKI
jgi:hypothetical protein